MVFLSAIIQLQTTLVFQPPTNISTDGSVTYVKEGTSATVERCQSGGSSPERSRTLQDLPESVRKRAPNTLQLFMQIYDVSVGIASCVSIIYDVIVYLCLKDAVRYNFTLSIYAVERYDSMYI